MTLNDKQNNTLISPSIGGYQALTTTKSTKGEDIWYKIKLGGSVLIKKISSLLSVDYYKSNSENQFKDIQLQLHATDPDPDPDPEPDVPDDLRTSVSNPYTFNIQGNKSFSGICELDVPYDVVTHGAAPWYYNSWSDKSKVSNLTIIDGGAKFNAKNVTNMTYMFRGCNNLTSLDLRNLNTNNVTNMMYIFYNCSRLESLNISNFNTSKVTSMSNMFDSCDALTSLDLSNFNTSKVTSMYRMFYGCGHLKNIICPNGFDCSRVTNMTDMFLFCPSFESPLHLKKVPKKFIESGSSPNDWVVKNVYTGANTRGVHYIVDSVISS